MLKEWLQLWHGLAFIEVILEQKFFKIRLSTVVLFTPLSCKGSFLELCYLCSFGISDTIHCLDLGCCFISKWVKLCIRLGLLLVLSASPCFVTMAYCLSVIACWFLNCFRSFLTSYHLHVLVCGRQSTARYVPAVVQRSPSCGSGKPQGLNFVCWRNGILCLATLCHRPCLLCYRWRKISWFLCKLYIPLFELLLFQLRYAVWVPVYHYT